MVANLGTANKEEEEEGMVLSVRILIINLIQDSKYSNRLLEEEGTRS